MHRGEYKMSLKTIFLFPKSNQNSTLYEIARKNNGILEILKILDT